jgi:hypothetical protein
VWLQITSGTYKASDHRGIGAFALQIELGGERGLHFAHDFARTDLIGVGMRAFHQRGDAAEQSDVAIDLFFDPGAQHFHHHLAATVQARRMHLRDRRRGQRRGVEMLESIADVLAERLFDDGARGLAVERLHPVLQHRQFLRDIRWHQVAPRGENLPEFHEDRPELLQRQSQARAARLRGHFGRGARHERAGEFQPALGRRAVEQGIQPVTQQDAADASSAQDSAHAAVLMPQSAF